MMRWPTLLTLFFQGLLVSLSIAEQRICYLPSTSTTDEVPCTSDDETFCCPEDSICLGDGVCFHVNGMYLARGSCTDQTYESSSCPQMCLGDDRDSNIKQPLISYIYQINDEPHYCCNGLMANGSQLLCYNNTSPFRMALRKAIVGRAALKGLGVSVPEDIKGISVNTSHIPEKYQVKSNKSGKETAIGAGVGVSLGVVALASLAWALWLLRQNRNLKRGKVQDTNGGKDQSQGQMGYGHQLGMMTPPSGGHMSLGSSTYGRGSHPVEQLDTHENPSELPGMPRRGP